MMMNLYNIDMYVKKCISIKKEHEEYLKSKCISLSRFVQKKIEEEMVRDGGYNKKSD